MAGGGRGLLSRPCAVQELVATIGASWRLTPYPHAVLNPALDARHYAELLASYPSPDLIVGSRVEKPNTLYQRHARDVIEDKRFAQVWRDFFAEMTSPKFWYWLGEIMELPRGRTGMRYRDVCEIELDCLFGVNTPVTREGSVKGPHLDNPKEIFACLIYFPEEGDDAGGDLGIYSPTKMHPKFYGQRRTDDVQLVDQVPYAPNRGFFFENGPRALHGVLPRKPTKHWRRYVNIEAEFHMPRFTVG